MRDQIIANEIKQFKEVLKQLYNSSTGVPQMTLVVVNKRINQRIFIQSKNQNSVENPPPGTIIDSNLVENQNENLCFDFFLVPQQTTQGCVTPTHFFVSLNESAEFSKKNIEDLTYCLCYMYSNWSGSIKVPAPCQCAHKIAEYHTTINNINQVQDKKQLGYNPNFLDHMYYL